MSAPLKVSSDSGNESSSFAALYFVPERQSAPTTSVTPETSVDFYTELIGMPRDLATRWASPSRSALG